jgi:hypothetical protein
MATIPPYVSEGAHAGQSADMKIRKLLWLTVGHGKVLALSDYEVDIDGQIDIVVYKGNLRIHLELLDQDAAAVAGPCRLGLNAHVDENATYQVQDGVLSVSAIIKQKSASVSLSRDDSGSKTRCVMTGYLDITAYLEASED